MRFFVLACLFCLVVASVGCMTKNWSSPLFQRSLPIGDSTSDAQPRAKFWKTKFGEGSGIDPRAREIEERLGL
jgi:hypothetical protein